MPTKNVLIKIFGIIITMTCEHEISFKILTESFEEIDHLGDIEVD